MDLANFNQFAALDIRVGTIIEIKDFPKARKSAYQLWVDFGEKIGIKKTSAQITHHYSKEDLIGKQIVAVINFPNKQIANFISECLILGAVQENGGVVLLQLEQTVQNGLPIG